MARVTRRILLITVAVLLLVAIAITVAWVQSPAEYVPVVMDGRQQLVENPALLTPEHLDRLEVVLKRYGEWYQRTDATHLRISRSLSRDRDLLWNYTTKSEDGQSSGG
ncbi:MAG: hypothetical protein WD042_09085 [Phycisphaeraceae bacterium]